MENISFWSSAVDLIDDLIQESREGDLLSAEQQIASFTEIHRDRFDPAEDFKEYVLVKFARVVAQLNELENEARQDER